MSTEEPMMPVPGQEQGQEPTLDTTLFILLGASQCHLSSIIGNSDPVPFVNSAQKVEEYFRWKYFQSSLLKPPDNILNLFDTEMIDDEIYQKIEEFIQKRRNKVRDVILYFIGHGFISNTDGGFYLVIRRSRDTNPEASSMAVKELATSLKSFTQSFRFTLILDCCSAATAQGSFQGPADSLAFTKIKDAFEAPGEKKSFPRRGVSLLCSSGSKVFSLIAPNKKSTMFTEGFVTVLSKGDADQNGSLSLQSGVELRKLLPAAK